MQVVVESSSVAHLKGELFKKLLVGEADSPSCRQAILNALLM